MSSPINCGWDWNNIIRNKNNTFRFEQSHDFPRNICLKGKLLHVESSPEHCIFLLDLDVNSLEALGELGLSTADLPSFGSQLDSLFIAESVRNRVRAQHSFELRAKTQKISALEEENTSALRMLEMKRSFVRSISHEIRTPLNIVSMGLKMLDECTSSATLAECVNAGLVRDMRESCSTAVDLLNDLLLYEKIEGNLLSMEFETLSIRDLVFGVTQPFRIQAAGKGVSLQVDFPKEEDASVRVDPSKFSQVLRNILSNAIKFTMAGGRVAVSITRVVRLPLGLEEPETLEEPRVDGKLAALELKAFKRPKTDLPHDDDTDIESTARSNTHVSASSRGTPPVPPVPPLSRGLLDLSSSSHKSSATSRPLLPAVLESARAAVTSARARDLLESLSPRELADGDDGDERDEFVPLDSLAKKDVGSGKDASGKRSQQPVQMIRINVVDNGSGISLEDQKRLFTQFTQINANKLQGGGGSGLGLWVARNIMIAHGGAIGVHSDGENCGGSTFFIDIPVVSLSDDMDIDPPAPLDLGPSPSAGPEAAPVNQTRLRSLLIVDDSSTNRKFVHRILSRHVDRVEEASDGREAIDKCFDPAGAAIVHDAIMLDSVMPVMSGPEAARELRARGYGGLIVGVTGNFLQADVDDFLAAGANRVMVKPLDVDQFLAFIRARDRPEP